MNDYCEYTKEIIERFNLTESITVKDYLDCPREITTKIPEKSGIVFIMYPYKEINLKEDFNRISDEELKEKWVEGADILYIGGTYRDRFHKFPSNIDLRTKIQRLLRKDYEYCFIRKDEKFIWLNKNSSHFKIYWYELNKYEKPYYLERKLIIDFIKKYGKPPLGNLSLPINNELDLNNIKDYVDYVCPQPPKWAKIHQSLINTYEKNTGEKLEKRGLSSYEAGGPPIPLILGGWHDSGDGWKSDRWQGMIRWAADHKLLYLIDVNEDEKYGRE